MPEERLPMRKIRDVLRLSAGGMSNRKIAASLGISPTAAGDCLRRARAAGLGWPLPEDISDEALESRLYPPPPSAKDQRPQPDWPTIHRELHRPGVTLQLLWEEHRAVHPDGYGYSRFCELYRAWEGRLSPTMRQTHVAGEKLFVDYAGTTLDGDRRHDRRGAAAHSCSSRCSAPATTPSPKLPGRKALADWIGSHMRTFEFFDGVPEIVCPGQPEVRHHQGVPLRAGGESSPTRRWRSTTAWRWCRRGPEAARQGQGRGRCAGGRALDYGHAAQAAFLLAGRGECRHPESW